ncbi:helix-turn-helix transcriptional regulator [Entomomonas asaccharolytica]|uniref:AlpA family phage regulatory protein n=1 Tax=Entomomonas asaccharolytica TaxID=2785331 RepID=A0A974NDU7_9GAMM|nr:AlpA family phage regulatory protein [Entomomonas asaccharolytica]QQP84790.1 AlpA family phage regulatory protein [Entomomonas asaccharolytica]
MKEEKLIRIEMVMEYTGLSRSSIYNYMKQGRFPENRKFGKSSFWSFNEVQGWISGVMG